MSADDDKGWSRKEWNEFEQNLQQQYELGNYLELAIEDKMKEMWGNTSPEYTAVSDASIGVQVATLYGRLWELSY